MQNVRVGFEGKAAQRAAGAAIERLNLMGVPEQPVDTLSKGFKRRVGLAQAILHDPQVLILDEPTDGLDPNQKHEVRQLIRRLGKRKAILFSTHILEIAQNMCDRVIIIDRGRILADAPVSELRQMKGDQSLEDIFLELTGGNAVDDLVQELGDGA